MSVNSSSASLPPSRSTFYALMLQCNTSRTSVISLTAYLVTITLFLLPLCVRVVYLGVQKWRRQPDAVICHSDAFTYHMVTTELLNILGSALNCLAVRTGQKALTTVGVCLFLINMNAQQYFHLLTGVERYLAVVHPITFLRLRGKRSMLIRNVSIGCSWLLSFAFTGLLILPEDAVNIASYLWTIIFLFVILFCSLSVVWVLVRPGPGDGQRVDQCKLRALHSMMVILGVLLFRFGSITIGSAVYFSGQLQNEDRCLALYCMTWMCLPSSLVLPLLYLHRAGKLTCYRKTDSGSEQRLDAR